MDFWHVGTWIGAVVEALVRQPFLVAELLLLGAILFGQLGKPLGVPLLFWHEKQGAQFVVGLSVGMLASAIFFTAYVLESVKADKMLAGAYAVWAMSVGERLGRVVLGGWICVAIVWFLGLLMAWLRSPAFRNRGLTQGPSPIPGQDDAVGLADRLPLYGGALTSAAFSIALALHADAIGGSLSGFLSHAALGQAVKALLLIDVPKELTEIHMAAFALASAFFILYAIGVWRGKGLTKLPAASVCTLLGLVSLVYGYLSYRGWGGWALLFVAVLLVAGAFINPYRSRLRVLADLYPNWNGRLTPFTETYTATIQPKAIDQWTLDWCRDGTKAPLVIVCASGGGIRSAVWTAQVLCGLENEIQGFPNFVRLVTGASGGMVGAAYWVATLTDPRGRTARGNHDVELTEIPRRLGMDSLSPVVSTLVFRDILSGIVPWVPSTCRTNRGQALEDCWRQQLAPTFDKTFGELHQGEAEGWRPSCVFAPMVIEDGRRVVFSNLSLDWWLENKFGTQLFSRSGYEANRLFAKEWNDFPLSSAVRMNASFPYVSPPVSLPVTPRLRLGDAGYFENYGVALAACWLEECLHNRKATDWLAKHVSGIALVQIRDGVSQLDGDPTLTADPEQGEKLNSFGALVGRAIEGLTAPPAGLLASWSGVLFRNDAHVEELLESYKADPAFGVGFLETFVFSFSRKASLSWYLTEKEQKALQDDVKATANLVEIRRLRDWFKAKGSAQSARLSL